MLTISAAAARISSQTPPWTGRSTAWYVYLASLTKPTWRSSLGLPSNQRRRESAPPSREDVLAQVEHADTGGHWYWLGDITHEGLDPWPVFRHDGNTWFVIRLLLPIEPGQRVHHVNTCGLRTCVNPDHWQLKPWG